MIGAGTPVGGPPAGGSDGHQRGLRDRVSSTRRAGTRDARTDSVHALSFYGSVHYIQGGARLWGTLNDGAGRDSG